MIQKSAVKKYVKAKEFRSSPDVIEALQRVVSIVLDSAIENAKRDKRKTIQADDVFMAEKLIQKND